MTAFFRVMATDGTPTFEAISQHVGVWSGVAKVEDDAEIARLKAAGKQEITEAQYEEDRKKKAERPGLPDFREIVGSSRVAQLAAKPAETRPFTAATPQTAKPATPPTPESIAQPAAVPPRRKSAQAI